MESDSGSESLLKLWLMGDAWILEERSDDLEIKVDLSGPNPLLVRSMYKCLNDLNNRHYDTEEMILFEGT